jgi:3-oxo-5-alpha-steroid 4-dehydrogenase 3
MLDLPVLLQIFYALAASSILLANSIPALQSRFVSYGKTSASTSSTPSNKDVTAFGKLLDFGATFTVPHHYFSHFYAVAIGNAFFWGWQVSTHGPVYKLVASYCRWEQTMGIEQVVITWLCFLAQAGRRLYECLYIQKVGGNSRMWIGHYIVGILFYSTMSISVWVEGISVTSLPFPSPADWKQTQLKTLPSLQSLCNISSTVPPSNLSSDS